MGGKAARRRTGFSYFVLLSFGPGKIIRVDTGRSHRGSLYYYVVCRDFISGLIMISIDNSEPGGARGSGCPE